ncbi:MAG: isochorismatase family cysteine hydrolase, partial [Oscillospiraceae bacterium]
TALLIVDMQNDLAEPVNRAYYPTTEKLMETFEQKINVLRNKGVQIVIIYSLVPDDHKPDPELTRITKTTRTLVEGTYGAEIEAGVANDPTRDWKIRKYAASSFLHTDLAQRLKEAGMENVLVSGVKTNVCCRRARTVSVSHGFRTILVSDMLATNTQELQDFHLKALDINMPLP